MDLRDRVAVVTGGGGGIGAALGRAFAEAGARRVVLVDRLAERVAEAAERVGEVATAVTLDVSDDAAVAALVDRVFGEFGALDLFCANAGVGEGTQLGSPDSEWDQVWRVNLMSTVVAARHLVPRWVERGGGYLLVTASAAGLLTSLGDAAYTATKHAAVGLAEWIAITYGDQGVKVSCLCPQGVRTHMTMRDPGGEGRLGLEQVRRLGMIEPDDVARTVVEGLADERFLILPHPEALNYFRAKAADHDHWLGGMRKFQRSLREG